MKATKFMTGDWVLINEVPKKIQAVDGVDDEIMADGEAYCLAEDRYHSEDKVTGVPITPPKSWRRMGLQTENSMQSLILKTGR